MALILELADLSLRFLQHTPLARDAEPTAAVSLGQLDLFLSQFASPTDFLQTAGARQRYFDLLGGYFSKRNFPRKSYDVVLAQFAQLNQDLPELTARLWQKPAHNSVELTLNKPASGRALHQNLWRVFRSRWLQQLETTAVNVTATRAQSLAKQLAQSVADFESKSAGLNKAAYLAAKGKFFNSLRRQEIPEQLAAYVVFEELVVPRRTYLLKLDDADLVLDFFDEIRGDVSSTLSRLFGNDTPDFLAWKIKSLIPDPAALLKDLQLFPRLTYRSARNREIVVGASVGTNYRTQEVRGFHGIFAGICYHDCLAGSHNKLEQCTPRRWAIGALAGSATYFFERNGRYQGSVRLVPVTDANGSAAYSAGLCVPIFNTRVMQEDRSMSLFCAWLPGFQSLIQQRGLPLAVSQSQLADLSQLKPTIWNSDAYLQGVDLGNAENFRVRDPQATSFLARISGGPAAHHYGQSFLIDSLFNDSGRLRALAQSPGQNYCVSASI